MFYYYDYYYYYYYDLLPEGLQPHAQRAGVRVGLHVAEKPNRVQHVVGDPEPHQDLLRSLPRCPHACDHKQTRGHDREKHEVANREEPYVHGEVEVAGESQHAQPLCGRELVSEGNVSRRPAVGHLVAPRLRQHIEGRQAIPVVVAGAEPVLRGVERPRDPPSEAPWARPPAALRRRPTPPSRTAPPALRRRRRRRLPRRRSEPAQRAARRGDA